MLFVLLCKDIRGTFPLLRTGLTPNLGELGFSKASVWHSSQTRRYPCELFPKASGKPKGRRVPTDTDSVMLSP